MTIRELEGLYLGTRERVAKLLVDADARAAATPVPACPEWQVRDVAAHLTGLCADVLAGNIAGAATDEWTAAQVEARRNCSLADILAEWDEVGPQFAAMIDDFPGGYGRQVAADITVHEQDIRGALGRAGARDSEALRRALDFLLVVVAGPSATALGVGPLEVRAGDASWTIGTGEPGSGDPEAAIAEALLQGPSGSQGDRQPVGSVAGEPFELFRAWTGRRSADQIRSLDWSVDPEPYLPLFAQGPFTMRTLPLEE